MSLSNLALNQLVGGLAVATSQYQLGRPATDIFNGLHPFLPTQELENGLSTVVDPLRRLAAEDGTLSPDLAPEALAGAFYEAARQLAQLTEESHPPISRLADDFRQVWRRGLSHPPTSEARAMALDFRDDDQVVESLRQFVEFSPQPMGVVKCRPDGSAEMVLFNRKNRERWNLNERDVVGVEALRFFYPEDHDMVRSVIRECLETGSASRSGIRILRQAGGHLLVDVYFGRVDATNYAYFQAIDETEREHAFEQVRIRDAVFRNAGKPLLMLAFDDGGMPVGMVTSAGFDRMLGYEP
ncbi:MAG TPA: PAS domain-containing protein, partial [bacterium]|nr:PAS domain-containing protein [bacterium]